MTSPTRTFIGSRLKAYRKRKGITQAVVAEALRCEVPTICRYERGDTTPDSEQLLMLAKLFEVNPMDLLPGEPDVLWTTVVRLRGVLLEHVYNINDPGSLVQLIDLAKEIRANC